MSDPERLPIKEVMVLHDPPENLSEQLAQKLPRGTLFVELYDGASLESLDEAAMREHGWVRLRPEMEHYFSTACMHNEHQTCRKVCKFCPEKCRCDCHKEDS
jgi:hypothetical protein